MRFLICSALVEWLVKRVGDTRFVLLCLPVSTIFAGFLPALLSVLGSPAITVNMKQGMEHREKEALLRPAGKVFLGPSNGWIY